MHEIPRVPRGNILFIPDSHWRDSDKKTIGGYVEASDLVSDDIEKIIIEEEITHIVSTGDWCDKGYRADHAKYGHSNRIEHWRDLVGGNLAMVIGNHFFLERDTNPELYWIQPHHEYRPTKKVFSIRPQIKVPKTIFIGCAQYSLFHFHKEDKEYVNERADGIKCHVGIYHDDLVIPASVRLEHNIKVNVESTYTKRIFANIDMAIMGHIHKPYAPMTMQVDGRDVIVDIIGASAHCKSNDTHKHVMLPIHKVTEDSITVSYRKLSLHTEKLRYYADKENKLPDDLFIPEDLRGTSNIEELMRRSVGEYMSCEAFLIASGAAESDLEVFRAGAKGELDTRTVVKNYKGEPNATIT